MTTDTLATGLVDAAGDIVTAHLDALRPLAAIARGTVADPPTVDAALTAVLHLHAARPALDHTVAELLWRTHAAGVTKPTLARLLGMREATMTKRMLAAPAAPTAPEIGPGMFKLRDKISARAARESLITAATGVGDAYLAALRPISRLSQGIMPEAATVDAALEAVVHLHRSRKALDAALDPVLAALILGGVKRMALADLLDCNAGTLQRRLTAQPLARARWADLEEVGNGAWRVEPAAVGRYAPKPAS